MSTETKSKHFAEPWLVTNDGELISIRSTGTDRADWQSYVAKVNESETFDQDHANAARIVACVNACAGVEDPAKAIAAVRRVLALTVRLIEELHDSPKSLQSDLNEGLPHLKESLRALGG